MSSCLFQEAKAIIAQRSGNPREFFKQKERALTISVDSSPVSIHRTGKHLRPAHCPVNAQRGLFRCLRNKNV